MTTKRRLTEDLRRSQDQGHLKNKFLVVGVVSDPQGEYNLDVEQGCLEERVRVPPGSRLSREMGVWTTKQPPFYSLRPLYPSRSSHYDGHDPDVMVARWPVLRFAMTTSAAIARLLFVCERFFFVILILFAIAHFAYSTSACYGENSKQGKRYELPYGRFKLLSLNDIDGFH